MKIQHERVEQGCFVFQVVRTDAHIQPVPIVDHEDEVDEEDDQFEDGELLAVDLIQPGDTATFVRLADQSGWVAAEVQGETFLKQIPVVSNILIPMVADVPQMVRRHPMDETSELLSSEFYSETSCIWQLQPMQTVYCDAMVEHPDSGIRFYRIQGAGSDVAPATPGWIHDQTIEQECKLLPHHKVQTGIFAFKALVDTTIRERPDCTNASKSPVKVRSGQIVVADLLRESPANNGNGPFLRLADGSGWLFCNKLHEPVMESLPVRNGHWIFTVLNDPEGINECEHPGRDDMPTEVSYAFGTVIECDKCIVNDSGNYYHVIGSHGWICDKEDKHSRRCLSLLQELKPSTKIMTSWTVDFVRGIAMAAPNALEETSHDKKLGILALQVYERFHFKVFYQSKTIGVFYRHEEEPLRKQFHSCCSPEELVQILSRSLDETFEYYKQNIASFEKPNEQPAPPSDGIDEEKKDDIGDTLPSSEAEPNSDAISQQATELARKIVEEDELRKQLLQLDAQVLEIQARRSKIIAALKPYDTERDAQALLMKEKLERRQQKNRQKYLQNQSISPVSKSKRSSRKKASRTKEISAKSSESNSLIDKGDGSSTMTSVATKQSRNMADVVPLCTQVEEEPSLEDSYRQSPTRNPVRCIECNKEFSGKYSRDLHCRNVHKLYCEHCDKIFRSFKELELHMEAEDHW